MPNIANLDIDPLALTALGFLGVVLALTLGLFGWLMTRGGKRKGS
ncbi:MAG: hypothetical protein R3C25_09470 [Hyphomonadaceae bacterium]